MMPEVGRQWLLALRGRFLLHLKIYSYRIGSLTFMADEELGAVT